MNEGLKEVLTSKRFWAAVTTIVVLCLNAFFHLGIDEETVWGIVLSVFALILGDTLRPINSVKAAKQDAEYERYLATRGDVVRHSPHQAP